MPTYFVRATGEIDSFFAAGAMAAQRVAAEAAGLTVVDDDGVYGRQTHVYQGGAFIPKPAPSAAEALIAVASAKRLELARQAEAFIGQLTAAELAGVQAADPSRTAERYPATWLSWARGQNEMAQIVAAHPLASAAQLARAATVKLNYLAVAVWCGRITAGPLAAAYQALAVAVAAGDVAAAQAVGMDLTAFVIGASGVDACPDPDVTRDALTLTTDDVALLEQA